MDPKQPDSATQDSTQPTPEQPMPPQSSPASPAQPDQTKTIVTILCLLFVTPIGIVLMWIWMKNWPKWLKIIITLLPLLFIMFMIALFVVIFASVPKDAWKTSVDYKMQSGYEQIEKSTQDESSATSNQATDGE
jgi:hypothetical protein